MASIARTIAGKILNFADRGDFVRKARSAYQLRFRSSTSWYHSVTNIIHVGANTGDEAAFYASMKLGVLWIEPIPSVFEILSENIRVYPKQKAVQALLTDADGQKMMLNIASNNGASSSIFDFADHTEIWPQVYFTDKISVTSRTLDDVIAAETIKYDGLIMDTQGSELLVLQGSTKHLRRFKYIKTEAADFEIYKGCATEHDLVKYLMQHGFTLSRKDVFAQKPDGSGTCSDLLFVRT
jgi:FkbM family methyltransferase